MPEDFRTPIEDAKAEYTRLRRAGGYRAIRSHEDRVLYMTYRHYSNYTRDWHRSHKAELYRQIRASLSETQEWLDKANAFAEWFAGLSIPTEKQHVYDFFLARVRGVIDIVQDSSDAFDLDDPDMGLVEQAVAAAEGLGLEYYEPYTDKDDGMVWFKDPDSDRLYMFALAFLLQPGRQFNTGQALYSYESPSDRRWRLVGVQPLNSSCIFGGSSRLPDVMRVFRDYHGMFSDIARMIDTEQSPLPFP